MREAKQDDWTPFDDYVVRAFKYHDDLLSSCKALTAREWAGHNAACIYCRRTASKGHADGCEFIKALEVLKRIEGETK